MTELDDGLRILALGLKIDRMVVETHHALDCARQHLVFGVHPGRLGEQLDIEPRFLEIAELLGKPGRQIDDLLDAADHDGDLLRGLDTAGRSDGDRQGGGEEQ